MLHCMPAHAYLNAATKGSLYQQAALASHSEVQDPLIDPIRGPVIDSSCPRVNFALELVEICQCHVQLRLAAFNIHGHEITLTASPEHQPAFVY